MIMGQDANNWIVSLANYSFIICTKLSFIGLHSNLLFVFCLIFFVFFDLYIGEVIGFSYGLIRYLKFEL